MKKAISTMLFIIFLVSSFCSFPTLISAKTISLYETGKGGIGGIEYDTEDYTLILSSSGAGIITKDRLPYNSLNGIPNGYFKRVIIKENITAIDDKAFYKWPFLTSVEIAETVTSIGDFAFADCYYDNGNEYTRSCLSEIIIPNSVVSIGDNAFNNCSDLTIYGNKDSVAEEYAKEHNIKFVRFYGFCTNCGNKLHTDIEVSATCTEDGLTEGARCLYCGNIFVAQEVIPALGHKPVIDSAVKATCQHEGLTVGSHCENCGEVYAAQQVIPKLPHEPEIDEAVEADCTHSGLTEGSHCEICGDIIEPQTVIPALGHKYIAVKGITATHIHAGITDGLYCDRCGEWFIKQEIIPKLEGDYLLGDSDGNGEVDMIDATYIQRSATRIVVPIAEDILMNGDIDEDDELTVVDATLIQRFSTHIAVPYPIGS